MNEPNKTTEYISKSEVLRLVEKYSLIHGCGAGAL